MEVLTKIYMALGTPTDDTWAGLRAMPAFMEFQPTPAPGLRKLFPASLAGVRGRAAAAPPVLRCNAPPRLRHHLSPAAHHTHHTTRHYPLPLQASDEALDLLSRMMTFDASRRISAADALQHRYFRSDPPPSTLDQLPKPHRRQAPAAGDGAAAGQVEAAGGAAAGDAAGADGGAAQPAAAAGGAGGGAAPGAATQQQQQQPTATPPFGGRALEDIPESLLGRVERPKLDDSDMQVGGGGGAGVVSVLKAWSSGRAAEEGGRFIMPLCLPALQFFKKRRFNLDDAGADEDGGA